MAAEERKKMLFEDLCTIFLAILLLIFAYNAFGTIGFCVVALIVGIKFLEDF